MVAPAFGWSAGDIVTSIKIIIRISKAFKEADGAVSQFAETTAFLDAFEATLRHIKEYTNENANAKYTDSIVEHVKVIDGPYSKFEKYMLDFCPALGEASTQSSVRKAPKKIKWALKEPFEVSGKVASLKRQIIDSMLFIGLMLLLQALETIQVLVSTTSQPNNAQLNTLMDCVKQAAIPAQLTHQIQDLTHAAQGHGDRLAALGQDLREFVRSLSQEQVEAQNTVAVVNEASRQQQTSRSTDTLRRMDDIRMKLERMLDSTIDVLDKRKHLEDDHIETVEKGLEEQRAALSKVQHSVEASVAKLKDTVAVVRMVRDEAENMRQSNTNTGWLGQFYGQLIASGITSTITGAFVFVATRLGHEGHEAPQAVTSRTHEKHLLKTVNAAATIQTSIPDETNFSSKALEASESESVSTDIAKNATRPPLETTSGARLSLESPQKAEHSETQSKIGLPNIATDEDGRAKLELNHLASDRKAPQSDHQGREKYSFGSLTQTSTIHAHTSKAAPSNDFRQRPEPHSPSNRHCATSPASAPATSFHTRTGFPASFSGSLSKVAAVHATDTSAYIPTQEYYAIEPPKTFSTSTSLRSFNSSTLHTNHQASSKASLPSNTTVQRNQSISQPFVGNSTVTAFVPQPQKFPSPARAEITTWFCCQCYQGPRILDLTQNCPFCGHLRDERCKGLHKSVSQFPTATVSSGPRPSRT